MNFQLEHLFRNISLEDFEKLYFDEDLNVALCKEVNLGRDVQERDITDEHIKRVIKVSPDRQIPAPVAKVIGGQKLEYTEYLNYKWGSLKGEWKTVSSIMSDKIDTKGTFSFVETPQGVRRLVDGHVKVKVFGVGKIVETLVVADVKKGFEDAANFTQKWINEKLA
ncbi:MAG: hypothetical protein CMH60_04240 [Myxococcales bacterium]|nr:hypothetical protein [Myxococcales bacterium]|tara:strand:+ start:117 stop:614 length:498 start_codon:yes stop_codon:yes gene_type:complete